MENGNKLNTDHLVVAVSFFLNLINIFRLIWIISSLKVGIEPDMNLAAESKLTVDKVNGGFQVNSELEAVPDLYVAGDAASFDDPALGRRRVCITFPDYSIPCIKKWKLNDLLKRGRGILGYIRGEQHSNLHVLV